MNAIRLVGRFFLKRALIRAARKVAPDRIPMSLPRALQRDYYEVHLYRGDADANDLMLDAVEGNTVRLRQYDGSRYVIPQALHIQDLDGMNVDIRFYLGLHEFRFQNPFAFELGSLTGYYRFQIWVEAIKQRLYNRKPLIVRERYALLKELVGRTCEDRRTRFTTVGLVAEFNGTRAVRHPQFRQKVDYYGLLLDSLVDEQLLSQADGAYTVLPRALAAMNNYEDELRRHGDNFRLQAILVVLALVSAFAAVAQAISTWKMPG